MSREVSTGDILEVVIRGRQDFQVCLSFFHYRLNNAVALSDGTTLVDGFDGLFNGAGGVVDKFAAAAAQNYFIEDITYQWIFTNRYTAQHKTPFMANGQVILDALPANVALGMLKTTFLSGRRQRGVLHLPGIPQDAVLNSIISAAGRARYTALAGVMATVYSLGTGEDFEPVIFNKQFPVTSPQIREVRIEETSRILRRRSVGLGK